jgi:hypothetical protein
MKYYYRVIGVRTGEFEFELKSTAVLSADVNPREHFTNVAKTFYHNTGDSPEGEQWFENKEEFYFFGGEVCAWLDSYKEITKEQYDVLKEFIY